MEEEEQAQLRPSDVLFKSGISTRLYVSTKILAGFTEDHWREFRIGAAEAKDRTASDFAIRAALFLADELIKLENNNLNK